MTRACVIGDTDVIVMACVISAANALTLVCAVGLFDDMVAAYVIGAADVLYNCIPSSQLKWSCTLVPNGPIDNNKASVQIMVWRRIGDKPLSEPKITKLTDAYMRN